MRDDTQESSLARVEQTSTPTTASGKPKPILRQVPIEEIKINPIESTAPVDEEIKNTLLEIAGEFDAREQSVASDIVGSVLPSFIQARAAQSPDRIASHVKTLATEVAETAASQFPTFTTGSIAALEAQASRIVSEVLSA